MGDRALAPRGDPGVADDELLEPLSRIANRPDGYHHLVAYPIEAERHDLEEQRFLAVVIVVQTRLGQSERPRNIADRGRIEAAIPEDLRGGAADFGAPGVRSGGRGASLTSHRVSRCIMRRPTGR